MVRGIDHPHFAFVGCQPGSVTGAPVTFQRARLGTRDLDPVPVLDSFQLPNPIALAIPSARHDGTSLRANTTTRQPKIELSGRVAILSQGSPADER